MHPQQTYPITTRSFLTLLLCCVGLLGCPAFGEEASIPTPRNYGRKPDELFYEMVTQHMKAIAAGKNEDFYRASIRLIFGREEELKADMATQLSRYPSIIEDSTTMQAMMIFKGKGKGEAAYHCLLTKTAELLGITSPLFMTQLFIDFLFANADPERIQRRQEELTFLLDNYTHMYELCDLSDKSDQPFTGTLSFYSFEKHPPVFQAALVHMKGVARKYMIGDSLGNLIEKVQPGAFEQTSTTFGLAYFQYLFYIAIDFGSLMILLQKIVTEFTKLLYVWWYLGPITSVGIVGDSEKDRRELNEPTPFNYSVYGLPIKFLNYIPLLGPLVSTGLYPFLLLLHFAQSFWTEFFPLNLWWTADAIYEHIKGSFMRRQAVQAVCEEVLKLLYDMHNSHKMIFKLYKLLKKNPALQERFNAEYKQLRRYCKSYRCESMREELRNIPYEVQGPTPPTFLEVCNPVNVRPASIVCTYSRIENLDKQPHKRFKAALIAATEVLYKSRIAKAIHQTGILPLSVAQPIEEPADHPILQVKEAYTPLLRNGYNDYEIVKNDIDLGGEVSTHMVTGINGGGKSTFLETTAGNEVAAHGPGVFFGKEGRFHIVGKIFYDAKTEDRIDKGDSLFMAETKRGAEEYDYVAQSERPVILFSDEMFGTGKYDAEATLGALSTSIADLPCPTTAVCCTHLTEFETLVTDRLGRTDFRFYQVAHTPEDGFTYKVIPGNVNQPLSYAILHREEIFRPEVLARHKDIYMQTDAPTAWKIQIDPSYQEPADTSHSYHMGHLALALLLLLLLLFFFHKRYAITLRKRE